MSLLKYVTIHFCQSWKILKSILQKFFYSFHIKVAHTEVQVRVKQRDFKASILAIEGD